MADSVRSKGGRARTLERQFARLHGLRKDNLGGGPLVQRVSGRDVKQAGGSVTKAQEKVARTGKSNLNPRFARKVK